MPELRERITGLIDDAAPSVTIEEIHTIARRDARRRAARVLGAATVIVVAAGVAALALALPRADKHATVRVEPSTTTAPPTPRPANGTQIGALRIDAIALRTSVYEGLDRVTQEKGPGHDPASPLPGEPGNVVIEGHRTTYNHPFYPLDRVHAGDRIELTIGDTLYAYAVESQRVVSPPDLAATLRGSNAALTLVTNDPPFSAGQRLVVSARALGTLTTHIEVAAHTVKAGTTMSAAVVTENHTGAPIELTDDHGCQVKFAVGLANHDHLAAWPFADDCLSRPLTIPVGVHRFPFTVRASYFLCSNTGKPQGSIPRCALGSTLPPLPPGKYFATYASHGDHQLPVPPPIAVVVS